MKILPILKGRFHSVLRVVIHIWAGQNEGETYVFEKS